MLDLLMFVKELKKEKQASKLVWWNKTE